jgi:UDP-glucose 4-epimerase
MQAAKINVIGAENVLDSTIEHSVEKMILLSTNEVCYPINAMGISKAMMEQVAIAKGRAF